VDWRVEVWPKPELVAEARSPLPELGVLFALALLVLLASAIHLARQLHAKSVLLRGARDELELRVQERTAELQSINKQLQAEIHERRQAEESLQELSGRLLRLRDEEQRRIARELHDSTAQILGALTINLERVQQFVLSGEISKVQKLLAHSTDLAERATTEVRTLSYLLHPPLLDDLGLEGAVPWYAAGFSSRCRIRVSVEMQPHLGRFSNETELALFRVVQEALTNIHRHSDSPTAEITLFKDASRVTVRVTDHGRGMPPGTVGKEGGAKAFIGVGIAGMQERIRQLEGVLEIESGDSGTRITATLPIVGAKPVSEHDSNRGNVKLTDTTAENPIPGE
jgi:signal transduction histidine kinase